MKYLLYGIVRYDEARRVSEPGLRLIAANGLAAAVSPVDGISGSLSSLIAYEHAVEAIHVQRTVIPLRYGCVMDSKSAVIRHLVSCREEYDSILDRISGMTEMGIRILWPARAGTIPVSARSPGGAYLASLRNRYHSAPALAPEEARLADRIALLLSGGFTEQRREVSSSSLGRLISLYFLTPKSYLEQFKDEIRQVAAPDGVKVLFSGPWPPYNFVTTCNVATACG